MIFWYKARHQKRAESSKLELQIKFLFAASCNLQQILCEFLEKVCARDLWQVADKLMSRGPILRVTWSETCSADWNLDQSATSIQILRWSRDTFLIELRLYREYPKFALQLKLVETQSLLWVEERLEIILTFLQKKSRIC